MGVPTDNRMREGKATIAESTIVRFRRTYRRRLRRLVRLGDPLADLVVAFPAAAFALATDFGTSDQRRSAVQLVKAGRPLKLIAKALGLPFWTRKLPPEVFAFDLPRDLPRDEAFGQRLVGFIPDAERPEMAGWFAGTLEVTRLAGEEPALWLARHPQLSPQQGELAPVQLFALLAWVSGEPDAFAARFLAGKWSKALAVGGLGKRATEWVQGLVVELAIGRNGLVDPWLNGGRAGAYKFTPIVSVDALNAEAEAMENCVASYGADLAQGRCRLFSVRRGTTPVATLEVRPHPMHERIPQITELRGRENVDVPAHVWKAAFQWLAQQQDYNLPLTYGGGYLPGITPNGTTWRQLWRPYWRDRGEHPLLPEEPTQDAVQAMVSAAHVLAQRASK
jgi:hypothetical protein